MKLTTKQVKAISETLAAVGRPGNWLHVKSEMKPWGVEQTINRLGKCWAFSFDNADNLISTLESSCRS